MDYFPFMKDCLKEFNYPQIQVLDDMQIADIFSTANRQFLTLWIFRQMDDGYSSFVENATKEDLADLINQNGLCKDLEKNDFMNGKSDSNKQMSILYKMFKYLKCLSETKNRPKNIEKVSNEELKQCFDLDINLFPMDGPKKTLNSQERETKLKEYQKEIVYLKNLIEANKPSNEIKNMPPLEANFNSKLSTALATLEINLPYFKRNVLDITKNREETDTQQIHFKQNFAETLKTCNENTGKILEFTKNMNVISNIQQHNNNEEITMNVYSNMKTLNRMREISELCGEATSLK